MGEHSHSFPLPHSQAHHKTPKNEPSNKCFIYIFSSFVFLCVALLIFSLIVLRVNSPTIDLSSISVRKFSISNTNSSSSSLNLTLIAEFSLDNSNFGPFIFDYVTVVFMYGGVIVGERSTGGGRAEAKGTTRMNVSVEASVENVSSDLNGSGILNMSSFAKFGGRIHLIHVLRKRIWSEISCSINLDLNTHQIQPRWVCE
ncbi:Late embryogenesis abundant protein, partial [Cucurbita argyrosperma subsp. argyrosperma]